MSDYLTFADETYLDPRGGFGDNVIVTDESYVGARNGFGPREGVSVTVDSRNGATNGFGVEDYLIPKRPTTTADMWFEPYKDTSGVSYAGGLSNPSGNQQSESRTATGLDIEMLANKRDGLRAEDVDLSNVKPQRQRRSPMLQAAMRGVDLFDMISGVDKNAYLGKTLANEIEYEKKLMEEDPEGYQADVNRAKILSQRAYETDDVELKKKYGAAIKKLLPFETQGLDDLTASGFYTGNEKMEIERLKAATQIAKQKLANEGGMEKTLAQNQGKIDVQTLKNASNEQIADAKISAQRDIASENNAYKMAIAQGRYDNALQIQQMRDQTQRDVAMLNNETRLRQEGMKQEGANYRSDSTNQTRLAQEGMRQEGQNYRMRENNQAKMDLEQLKQKGRMERQELINKGNIERAKITAAAKGKGTTAEKASALQLKVAPDRLREMKRLSDAAGRWDSNKYDRNNPDQGWWDRRSIVGKDFGVDSYYNTQETKDYQKFEGMAKQLVQDQLRLIYGSQFTEKEGERFFQSMGLSPLIDPSVRWDLCLDAINDIRVKNGYNAIDKNTFEEIPGTAAILPGQEGQAQQQAPQSNGVQRVEGRRIF